MTMGLWFVPSPTWSFLKKKGNSGLGAKFRSGAGKGRDVCRVPMSNKDRFRNGDFCLPRVRVSSVHGTPSNWSIRNGKFVTSPAL